MFEQIRDCFTGAPVDDQTARRAARDFLAFLMQQDRRRAGTSDDWQALYDALCILRSKIDGGST